MTVLVEKDKVIDDTLTVLGEVFGDSPEVKILDFFMDHPFNDYMQSELAGRTGMNPRTVRRVLESLLSNEIIRVNRKIAKSKLYKLNSKSPIVRDIRALELTISIQGIE